MSCSLAAAEKLSPADHSRRRSSRLGQPGAHISFVQSLHRVPVQLQFLGDVMDRGAAAAATDVKGKPLGVERVVRQELEALALHLAAERHATCRTSNSPGRCASRRPEGQPGEACDLDALHLESPDPSAGASLGGSSELRQELASDSGPLRPPAPQDGRRPNGASGSRRRL
jgi:hypothetical protein